MLATRFYRRSTWMKRGPPDGNKHSLLCKDIADKEVCEEAFDNGAPRRVGPAATRPSSPVEQRGVSLVGCMEAVWWY